MTAAICASEWPKAAIDSATVRDSVKPSGKKTRVPAAGASSPSPHRFLRAAAGTAGAGAKARPAIAAVRGGCATAGAGAGPDLTSHPMGAPLNHLQTELPVWA